MRSAPGRAKTASHVRAYPPQIVLVMFLGSVLACGKGASELREWRPDDHQPPPAVMPEGQGAAQESGDPNARAAAALFSMRCASCHGEHGRGDGSGRPPGAQVPDFGNQAFQDARSDQQLHDVIAKDRKSVV